MARYTLLGYQRNKEILEKLKIEPADKKLKRCKSDWLRHVTRMDNDKITKNNVEV